MARPYLEILSIDKVPLDLSSLQIEDKPLKITYATITYELKDEGIADECEITLWFPRLKDIDQFKEKYIQTQVNMVILYGFEGKETSETAQFQLRGIKVQGDENGGYKLILKGYSPILEGNDKVAKGYFFFADETPMKASEVIQEMARLNSWSIVDEKGKSTILTSTDSPERPYQVEQIGDFFESWAQLAQRMANMVDFDFWMRYHKITGQPIIYFKPRNTAQNVSFDFEYFYDTIDKDEFSLIRDYIFDLSVTQTPKVISAATNRQPLVEFKLDDTQRGADSASVPAPNSVSVVSVTERTTEAVKPILENIHTKELEDLAEVKMTTLGNPLAGHGQTIMIRNTDAFTAGIWNVVKVIHQFKFDTPDYSTIWTLKKNSVPTDNKTTLNNKEDKLTEFKLDEEANK